MQILNMNFHFVVESCPLRQTTLAPIAIYCHQVVSRSPLSNQINLRAEESSKVRSVCLNRKRREWDTECGSSESAGLFGCNTCMIPHVTGLTPEKCRNYII